MERTSATITDNIITSMIRLLPKISSSEDASKKTPGFH